MRGANNSFLIMDIMSLIIVLGFILVVFDLGGIFFIGEFILLCLLILTMVISLILIFNDVKFGWGMLAVLLFLMLLDLLLIYVRTSEIGINFLITLFMAAIAFVIALVNSGKKKKNEELPEEEPSVSTEFKPGKYIASKMGKTYHTPKCDWAKNIKEKNAVWFDDEKEAKKAGYERHSCLNE